MKNIKYRVVFWPDIPERTSVVDSDNFFPNFFIGFNGLLYENYGTKDEPMWEVVFDSDYKIEIINN